MPCNADVPSVRVCVPVRLVCKQARINFLEKELGRMSNSNDAIVHEVEKDNVEHEVQQDILPMMVLTICFHPIGLCAPQARGHCVRRFPLTLSGSCLKFLSRALFSSPLRRILRTNAERSPRGVLSTSTAVNKEARRIPR